MAAVLFRASAAALRRTQPQSIPMAALRSVRTVPRRFAGGAPPPPPPPPPTPRGVIAWYGAQLAARPLLTKAISAGVLGFAGDVIAQLAVEQRGGFSLDLHRLGVFTGVGAVIIAPVLHVWYNFLARSVKGGVAMSVVKRLVLDQFAFAPIFIAFMLATMLYLEGRGDDVTRHLEDNWASTLVQNWKVWIPAQLINFAFVPPLYQVLFANSIGLVWNAYISVVAHRTPESHIATEDTAAKPSNNVVSRNAPATAAGAAGPPGSTADTTEGNQATFDGSVRTSL